MDEGVLVCMSAGANEDIASDVQIKLEEVSIWRLSFVY